MNLKEAQKAMIDGKKVRKDSWSRQYHVLFDGKRFVDELGKECEMYNNGRWVIIEDKPKRIVKEVYYILEKLNTGSRVVVTNVESYDECMRAIKEDLPDGVYRISKMHEVTNE